LRGSVDTDDDAGFVDLDVSSMCLLAIFNDAHFVVVVVDNDVGHYVHMNWSTQPQRSKPRAPTAALLGTPVN
jgi:hypothetical protein